MQNKNTMYRSRRSVSSSSSSGFSRRVKRQIGSSVEEYYANVATYLNLYPTWTYRLDDITAPLNNGGDSRYRHDEDDGHDAHTGAEACPFTGPSRRPLVGQTITNGRVEFTDNDQHRNGKIEPRNRDKRNTKSKGAKRCDLRQQSGVVYNVLSNDHSQQGDLLSTSTRDVIEGDECVQSQSDQGKLDASAPKKRKNRFRKQRQRRNMKRRGEEEGVNQNMSKYSLDFPAFSFKNYESKDSLGITQGSEDPSMSYAHGSQWYTPSGYCWACSMTNCSIHQDLHVAVHQELSVHPEYPLCYICNINDFYANPDSITAIPLVNAADQCLEDLRHQVSASAAPTMETANTHGTSHGSSSHRQVYMSCKYGDLDQGIREQARAASTSTYSSCTLRYTVGCTDTREGHPPLQSHEGMNVHREYIARQSHDGGIHESEAYID